MSAILLLCVDASSSGRRLRQGATYTAIGLWQCTGCGVQAWALEELPPPDGALSGMCMKCRRERGFGPTDIVYAWAMRRFIRLNDGQPETITRDTEVTA